MRVLLDTHVFLWWLADSRRLSASCRKAIASTESLVLVSAASIWEIAIKASIGKLAVPLDTPLDGLTAACGFVELPVTARHAAHVLTLPAHHSDPFDRLLVAQAKLESLTIATADGSFAPYGVGVLAT